MCPRADCVINNYLTLLNMYIHMTFLKKKHKLICHYQESYKKLRLTELPEKHQKLSKEHIELQERMQVTPGPEGMALKQCNSSRTRIVS